MNDFYTKERNVQIVLSLLKEHGIKRVVASPGSTNIAVVGSMQHDSFFEIYSCVDERSAAYMACGIAAETGEPVVLSCTGATASRNYYPGLTEAYYRKLPVLALTSSQDSRRKGHLKDQITERSQPPCDVVKLTANLQNIRDEEDEWDVTIKANRAILELNHHGRGPVHINIETTYCREFSVKEFAPVRAIRRYTYHDKFPDLPDGKIGIFIGSHIRFTEQETKAIDSFCRCHNSVVFCEPASGYHGKYAVYYTLCAMNNWQIENLDLSLIIHLGEISGFFWQCKSAKQIWRVSEDGELRDWLRKLTNVFEMREIDFFKHYISDSVKGDDSNLELCQAAVRNIFSNIPDLPFSNLWIAQQLKDRIPQGAVLHLGILSSLRSWNYMGYAIGYETDCNEGGFGIDGNMSTLIGASFVNQQKLYFCVVGDLSFFYDMNVLGNRHVGNNVRILIINNGLGCEFRLFNQVGNILGKETDSYISAGGHFGNKSPNIIKDLANNWGYEYLCAIDKETFQNAAPRFVESSLTDKPMIFEVFTNVEDENTALLQIENFGTTQKESFVNNAKSILGKFLKK